MFCCHLQVGNFRVEPPSLFRGRGEHPKMGKIKQRVYPRDITINIGNDAPVPEHPYPGQKWKEVRFAGNQLASNLCVHHSIGSSEGVVAVCSLHARQPAGRPRATRVFTVLVDADAESQLPMGCRYGMTTLSLG
eukprot:GHUV01052799.1.p1 GENE.GHUV01052799.1~~GHUV01052799.1.p1  ORF type:complete len:134 (-),score=22.33 GHUV01052799.1:31-432(-)